VVFDHNELGKSAVGNVKNTVSKLAMDHPRLWHTYISSVMWVLRECERHNGCSSLDFGDRFLPKGPLAILKDSWTKDDVYFGKSNSAYLKDLYETLEIAKEYDPAMVHW